MATKFNSIAVFVSKNSSVKMDKSGNITVVGPNHRQYPFDDKKFKKADNNPLKYAISRTNLQDLAIADSSKFTDKSKEVSKLRKEVAVKNMVSEGWDEQELDNKIESKIVRIGELTDELAMEKAELAAVRATLKAGPDAATKKANKAKETELFNSMNLLMKVQFGKAKATPEKIEEAKAIVAKAEAAKAKTETAPTVDPSAPEVQA